MQQPSGHIISKYNNYKNNNNNNNNNNNKIYAWQLLGSVCPIWWEVTNNLKTYCFHYPFSANVDWSDYSDIQACPSLRCACTWFCRKWCPYRTLSLSLSLSLCLSLSHTHTHKYTQTHTHTYIHTCIHAYINTNHTYIHTYIHTNIHTYIRTNVPTYVRTFIHTYIYTTWKLEVRSKKLEVRS